MFSRELRERTKADVFILLPDADGFTRVTAGVFGSVAQAAAFLESLARQFPKDYPDAFIVNLVEDSSGKVHVGKR